MNSLFALSLLLTVWTLGVDSAKYPSEKYGKDYKYSDSGSSSSSSEASYSKSSSSSSSSEVAYHSSSSSSCEDDVCRNPGQTAGVILDPSAAQLIDHCMWAPLSMSGSCPCSEGLSKVFYNVLPSNGEICPMPFNIFFIGHGQYECADFCACQGETCYTIAGANVFSVFYVPVCYNDNQHCGVILDIGCSGGPLCLPGNCPQGLTNNATKELAFTCADACLFEHISPSDNYLVVDSISCGGCDVIKGAAQKCGGPYRPVYQVDAVTPCFANMLYTFAVNPSASVSRGNVQNSAAQSSSSPLTAAEFNRQLVAKDPTFAASMPQGTKITTLGGDEFTFTRVYPDAAALQTQDTQNQAAQPDQQQQLPQQQVQQQEQPPLQQGNNVGGGQQQQ